MPWMTNMSLQLHLSFWYDLTDGNKLNMIHQKKINLASLPCSQCDICIGPMGEPQRLYSHSH